MLTNKAYKLELDPNNVQTTMFKQHCGVYRYVYNWGLYNRLERYKKTGNGTTFFKQNKELTILKKENPWLYDVSKWVGQDALRDLDFAYKNFFLKRAGFPKFKKSGCRDSFTVYSQLENNGSNIRLPKIGNVKTKEVRLFEGKIKHATVSRTADKWFVSFCVEEEVPDPIPVKGDTIGIDFGIKTFATLSDGTEVNSPKPLNRWMRRLKFLQRAHSRKKKGSRNRSKSARKLAKLHYRISSIRKDFLHKFTTSLAKTKSVICIEDLAVSNMVKNHNLARSISDQGWSEARRQLTYKCQWYGSKLVVIDRFAASSKLCSECGSKNELLTLADRSWVCLNCGTKHDRDVNAAINILKIGTGGLSGTNASNSVKDCGEAGVAKPLDETVTKQSVTFGHLELFKDQFS